MKNGEWIGWLSSLILLVTIGRQVYTQYRSESAQGVSHWLFVGQLSASTGYVVYSWILHNWVFLVSNVAMLLTAVLGQIIFLRNTHRHAHAGSPASA